MSFSKNLEVILVEDDPYDAELLMRVFKKHSFGSKVVILKDGAEAIDYFFKNSSNEGSCENKARIAFLDLKMPRVDGIEVLRRLKSDARTKNMPIIILTGSKEERDLKNAFALGVTSYITKPLKSEQFVSLMSQLGAKIDVVDRKVCVLVLEDDPAEAELIKRELQKSICNVAVEIATDKESFQNALGRFNPDLLLTDYNVPSFNGITAMFLARQSFPDIPTIIVSGTMGDELAVEALKSGANDYVLKSRISRLGPVINRALLEAKQVAERKEAEEELKRRTEELEETQIKLENKAAEVEEYACRMEELAKERAMKLKDAERLAAIGATAGMVGHDIRNPLQAITGDVYLVRTDLTSMPEGDEKEGMKESLEEIEKNIGYINKIVADLQDFARPINPVPRETDLDSLCLELIARNSIPKNIAASCLIENEAKKVIADPDALKRIISNLVVNAVQAMPHGGKLAINGRYEGEMIILTIEDTGVGVPEEVKDKLFTPLFTTKSKGQGFGLAVVKRFTEALGGTVTFESKEGEGTQFIVRLPLPKE